MIFYFTATGNCLSVARELGDNPLSIAQELKKDELHYEDETIGIVAPVYAGELPKIVRRFLEKASFKADYMYMVLTYGMNDSVAGEWSYFYGRSLDLNFDYIKTMKMVDNYVPSFNMVEQKEMDKQIPKQLAVIKKDLAERKKFIPRYTDDGLEKYDMVARRPKELNNGEQITVEDDKCVGCGMCTLVCPVGNFYLDGSLAKRHHEECEFCLACVHHCSTKAIYCKASDKSREDRYINENVKVIDIINANKQ